MCVLETDMFYLAISMVGTDFTMMAQLLTHRNRTEIKVAPSSIQTKKVFEYLENILHLDNLFVCSLFERVNLKRRRKRTDGE